MASRGHRDASSTNCPEFGDQLNGRTHGNVSCTMCMITFHTFPSLQSFWHHSVSDYMPVTEWFGKRRWYSNLATYVTYAAGEGSLPRVLRKYVSKEFYLKMEKLQTLLRLSFLVVANIEVCPQGGLWLCRWYSECRPKSFTHIAGWQNRLFHLESKAVNREVGKRTELND